MFDAARGRFRSEPLLTALIATGVLLAAAYFGQHASTRWLFLLLAVIGGIALLLQPELGLLALIAAALLLPLEFDTGTAITINPATLLIPILLGLWFLAMLLHRRLRFVSSRTTLPLLLFLASGLISLLIGRATWDPMVPLSASFLLVQMAQWAIFAFSTGAFWLTANLIRDERWLWRLTATFLLLAGSVVILRTIPGLGGLTGRFTTIAFVRTPLWILLAGLAGGQLLFNHRLTSHWRLFLAAILAAVMVYTFVQQKETASNWVSVGVVAGILAWLRFPRLRLPVVAIFMILVLLGLLVPTVYEFAGGDAEWRLSGGSRLVLIERVIEVTMRNPITGLGPAAYRPYANMKPLNYLGAFWVAPLINSHNNYVDLFSHIGLVGLAIFFWFVAEVALMGTRLRHRFTKGFTAGYVNGILAVGVGALVIMLLADWILPFVYNIGFPGFQASVLVWLFLGGLVVLENIGEREARRHGKGETG